MTRPLKIAVVGANAQRGWARDAHIPALQQLEGVDLHAVSARTQAGAEEAAEAFSATLAFGDSLEMVRDSSIDVVAVTVKVPEHRAVVLAALEAGKHVYCEWPLGRDVAEAEDMAAAASGAHALIGLQALSAPAVMAATALVRSGALGRLMTLRVVSPTAGWGAEAPPAYAYLQDRDTGAGFEAIAGGHTLALIDAVVGPYREIDARATTQRPIVRISGGDETVARSCADHLAIIGLHASGCVSTTEVMSDAATTPFVFELKGDAGWLRLTGGGPGGYQTGRLALESNVGPSVSDEANADLRGGAVGLARAYARFFQDIRERTHTVPDFADALRLTRLLDAIDRSSHTGVRQHLLEEPEAIAEANRLAQPWGLAING